MGRGSAGVIWLEMICEIEEKLNRRSRDKGKAGTGLSGKIFWWGPSQVSRVGTAVRILRELGKPTSVAWNCLPTLEWLAFPQVLSCLMPSVLGLRFGALDGEIMRTSLRTIPPSLWTKFHDGQIRHVVNELAPGFLLGITFLYDIKG